MVNNIHLFSPDMCPQLMCTEICKYSYKRDENGCQTCDCEEPCKVISQLSSLCYVLKIDSLLNNCQQIPDDCYC